ncbi:flippase-like domain-containing protein [candidate division KSB1 bacterium]|nr:flippase-like domain-containing protein [candidate division KSB1 bacterium]
MKPLIDLTAFSTRNISGIVRKLIIFVVIGLLGNIIFALWTSDRSLWNAGIHFNMWYILIALLLTLVPWLFHAWRMIIWTDFVGRRISFKSAIKIVLGTELGAAISPSTIGGGPVKAAMLMQQKLSSGVAASLTALGSIEDNIVMLVLVPLALTISGSWHMPGIQLFLNRIWPIIVWALVIVAILLAGLFIMYRYRPRLRLPAICYRFLDSPLMKRLHRFLKQFWHEFKSVYRLIGRRGRKRLAASLTITAVQWVCRYSVIAALIASMNGPVNIYQLFAMQWVVFSLTVFIPTPGAAAGAEAAYLFIYRGLIPEGLLNPSMLAWRFFTFYLLIIIGIILIIVLNLPRPTLPKSRLRPVIKPLSVPADS